MRYRYLYLYSVVILRWVQLIIAMLLLNQVQISRMRGIETSIYTTGWYPPRSSCAVILRCVICQVDNCDVTFKPGTLEIGPSYGPMLGGLTVTVSGPCFDGHSDTSNVVCKFDDIVTPATVIDATRAQCVLPALLKTGQVPVAVSTDGGHNYDHAGLFTLGKYR